MSIPTLLGAVVVRRGQFAGVYHDDEINQLVEKLIKQNVTVGPYGLWWTFDLGDCDFADCSIALEGDPQHRSWDGKRALNDVVAAVKQMLLRAA